MLKFGVRADTYKVSYDALPEINHKFREPEPRPPVIISLAFAICCGLPVILLIAMWGIIGINFGNVRGGLWSLGFHVGLGSIFGLYFMYWLHLNMFDTLKYLLFIGTFTFVCGNRLLITFNKTTRA